MTSEGDRGAREIARARELGEHGEAVLTAQCQIEKDDVGPLRRRDFHRLANVESGAHTMSRLLQKEAKRVDHQRAVIYQQDVWRHLRSGAGGGW
jgi:hypothetical protein